MHAWCDELREFRTISKDDVIDASPVARAWIDGFLAGSEPDLHEFLGVTDDEAGHIAGDDPAFERWRAHLAESRESGWMPPLLLRPSAPVPAQAEHLDPWCWVGGEFWAWRDRQWSVIDPPPPMRDGFLETSVCHARGNCDLALFGDYAICVDCGDCCEGEREPDDD
jgi:hypothetical protein